VIIELRLARDPPRINPRPPVGVLANDSQAPGLSRRTVDLIRRRGMERDVTITSFARARLEEVRACGLDVPLGWLVAEAPETIIAEAGELGVAQLCPRASTVTGTLVSRLHDADFLVRAWGVSREQLMEQVVHAGADGMTVNFPERLIAFLTSRGLAWAYLGSTRSEISNDERWTSPGAPGDR
jgi:glycerophosphoryl diester phosphodiesterase